LHARALFIAGAPQNQQRSHQQLADPAGPAGDLYAALVAYP
jgi:hypothetical protein